MIPTGIHAPPPASPSTDAEPGWTERWEYLGVLALIALSPLMLQNIYTSPFASTWLNRIQIVDLVFLAVFALWTVRTLEQPARLRRVPLKFPVGLFVATTALSSIDADVPALAALETVTKVYVAFLYVVVASVLVSRDQRVRAVQVWLLATAVVVIVGLLGYVAAKSTGEPNYLVYAARDMPFFGRSFRIKSVMQPTSKLLSTYLLIGIPLTIALFSRLNRAHHVIWSIGLMLAVIVDVLTISRGIVPLLVASGLVLRGIHPKWTGQRLASTTLLILGSVGMVGIAFVSTIRVLSFEISRDSDPTVQVTDAHYYASDPERGLSSVTLSLDYAYDSYFWLKKAAVLMWREEPLLGAGAGNFGPRLAQLKEKGALPEAIYPFGTAQSEPFDRLAETGLLGFIALLFLVGATLRELLRWRTVDEESARLRVAAIAALTGVALAALDLDVTSFRFLWIFLGIVVAWSASSKVATSAASVGYPE